MRVQERRWEEVREGIDSIKQTKKLTPSFFSFSPSHDALLPLSRADAPVEFRGYAYSGGGRKVTRVELSLDGGDSWRPAAIDVVAPPTKHGMHWAWVWWRLAVPTADLAAARDVRLRAADSSMNCQVRGKRRKRRGFFFSLIDPNQSSIHPPFPSFPLLFPSPTN